jgi:hypothetical protein
MMRIGIVASCLLCGCFAACSITVRRVAVARKPLFRMAG